MKKRFNAVMLHYFRYCDFSILVQAGILRSLFYDLNGDWKMSGNSNVQKIEVTPENKCSFCTGTKCCIYVTQEMETPRSMSDFDHMLWQMAHKDMQVYKDEDGWFLIAMNKCQFLQNDGGCGIYETRPQICRDYSNDFCEYDEPAEIHFEFYFKEYKELDDYCRKRFKKWDQRFED